MAIEPIMKQLKALGENIPGIQTVFDFTPYSVDDAELPALIIWPGRASYKYISEDVLETPRIYNFLVLYGKFLQGTEGETQLRSYALHDAIKLFLSEQHALITDAGERVILSINSDDGIVPRPYPINTDQLFMGTGWTITCTDWEKF